MIERILSAKGSGLFHSQRFEFKYIITPMQAEMAKEFIQPYVIPDPKAKFGAKYPLCSLYFDSPDFRLFWSNRAGEKNRFKLRIRSYSDDSSEPLFFEIKRRLDKIIQKQRVRINRNHISEALEMNNHFNRCLYEENEQEEKNLVYFTNYIHSLAAKPSALVRYQREAFVSKLDEYVRITFDWNLCYKRCLGLEIPLNGPGFCLIHNIPCILEIKFRDRFPFWINELVKKFHLLRDSIAKYSESINKLKQEAILPRDY